MQIKKEYQNISFSNGHYIIDGKPYERVSTFLANLDKQVLIQWASNQAVEFIDKKLSDKFDINKFSYVFDDEFKKDMLTLAKTAHTRTKEDAGDIGTIIHRAIECWLTTKPFYHSAKNQQDLNTINLALENFKEWWAKEKFELVASEMYLGSLEYGYGGTADIVVKQGDNLVLIDLKTSKGIYKSHKIQCGLYAIALDEMFDRTENYCPEFDCVYKVIICHIPKNNPKVKAIEVAGDEFLNCKKAGVDLVRLYYDLQGVK